MELQDYGKETNSFFSYQILFNIMHKVIFFHNEHKQFDCKTNLKATYRNVLVIFICFTTHYKKDKWDLFTAISMTDKGIFGENLLKWISHQLECAVYLPVKIPEIE